jgi:Zinc finger, C2HC type
LSANAAIPRQDSSFAGHVVVCKINAISIKNDCNMQDQTEFKLLIFLFVAAAEQFAVQSNCPTPGCEGIGHVKGAKYVKHHRYGKL